MLHVYLKRMCILLLFKSSIRSFLVVLSIIETEIMKSPNVIVDWISALKYLPGALNTL